MDKSRRQFLRVAGVTVVGIGGAVPFIAAGTNKARQDPAPQALKGKRYGLVVDTTKCARNDGCRACIDVCHREHNVPDIDDGAEEVKWIWKEPTERVFHEYVSEYSAHDLLDRQLPVLCNHCDDPPCVKVCPTKATFKREDGPVMMDQHRCIGCRYCIAGCPYGARSFNWKDPRPFIKNINDKFPTRTKGVVEKCTMCTERLAEGLIPACVEACAETGAKAMLFGDLEDPNSEIREFIKSNFTVRRKAELGTHPQVHYKL
ncbi:MAG: sulfate reduction electron transfer complex DsrMKJOP subunit DsrO [Planctomycetota bacterium]|jgi:molybdopterin-containing oxidoreductase family iron-sulfur binding subunit